ncbi:MAG: BREX-3 system P-loop-containing protein BrxF [Candidatus Methanoperedenaceae archaeon]|nr:BREX-3 system P-loop-containing protein BrxF [Candidatus Methanoperedenaceae archaeon]
MLVIIDNNHQHEKIINALKNDGWNSYNVEENILKITENIPESKIKVRIGNKIKDWSNNLPDKVILYNTNILYSPELGKLNPVGAFKYRSRDRECIVILEGSVSGNRIQYSEYGKEDHVEMDVSELIHVKMEDIDV